MCKEKVVVQFEGLFQNLCGGIEEEQELQMRYPEGRDLNPESPK
jgi:hypothetical protein